MTWLQPIPIARLVDFAAAHPRYRRNVDEDIRREFGITPARYFQLLGRAIATEEALKHDPITVHRLRREADRRARIREARTAGH